MSMLAERRRKTKWVINPTKKPIWTTDSEGIKLGKQLMEKMGWSAGKGLGANEQGIQEPLKVSYKNDTKGMGFKGNDEDWIEHQDEFNSLLSQLSSSDPSKPAAVDKNEIKSLEEKSKHSRARVHYQKFTRGKDLSRYSETDLACILGINHNKKQKNSAEEKSPVEEKKDGNYETSFGVTTINSGSIQDYFKKKWTFGQSKENNSSKTSDEVTEVTLNNTDECAVTPEHRKSRKQKINELDGENVEVPEDNTIKAFGEVENVEVGEEVKKNRKSKKRKLNELNGENLEVAENEKVEASEEVDDFCNSETERESKKHKKSKKKKKEEMNVESESVSKAQNKVKYDADYSDQIKENNQDTHVTAAVENVSSDNNLSLNDDKFESLQSSRVKCNDGEESFIRKRKKDKKKHKTKDLDGSEENPEPFPEGFDGNIKTKKRKDKGKKDKDHVTQTEMKEVSGENCSDEGKHKSSLTDNAESVSNADETRSVEETAMKRDADLEPEKSKKEKRKKDKHKLNQSKVQDIGEEKMECEIVAEEVESKSKKKKKKDKHSDQSLLENEIEQEVKSESVLEVVEPIVKEKKKKGKHKADQSKVEGETETGSRSEECKRKEKKKKEKFRSDQSTVENEEEQVTKSKSEPEETEPKMKEKKNKSGEGRKSKHKTDSEGGCKSNINSETVNETNDTSTVREESEGIKKAEVDIKVKEDCKKLAQGNDPKKSDSKTDASNRIHSHKLELFKRKESIMNFQNNRVMSLFFGAEFEKFKGANVENLAGYGMQKKSRGKDDG